jgi:hypothetical protein
MPYAALPSCACTPGWRAVRPLRGTWLRVAVLPRHHVVLRAHASCVPRYCCHARKARTWPLPADPSIPVSRRPFACVCAFAQRACLRAFAQRACARSAKAPAPGPGQRADTGASGYCECTGPQRPRCQCAGAGASRRVPGPASALNGAFGAAPTLACGTACLGDGQAAGQGTLGAREPRPRSNPAGLRRADLRVAGD